MLLAWLSDGQTPNKQGERKGKKKKLQAAAHSLSQIFHSFQLFCKILYLDVFHSAVKMKDIISQHLEIQTAHASCSLHLSHFQHRYLEAI